MYILSSNNTVNYEGSVETLHRTNRP